MKRENRENESTVFYVLCKKQNPLQAENGCRLSRQTKRWKCRHWKREGTAVSDDVMIQKMLVKNSASNVF